MLNIGLNDPWNPFQYLFLCVLNTVIVWDSKTKRNVTIWQPIVDTGSEQEE